jgi:hypothetical protein
MNITLTPEQKARFDELAQAHEAARQQIIARDGEVLLFRNYPELENLAHEMFMIVTNGTGHLTLTPEWVEANADEVVQL